MDYASAGGGGISASQGRVYVIHSSSAFTDHSSILEQRSGFCGAEVIPALEWGTFESTEDVDNLQFECPGLMSTLSTRRGTLYTYQLCCSQRLTITSTYLPPFKTMYIFKFSRFIFEKT